MNWVTLVTGQAGSESMRNAMSAKMDLLRYQVCVTDFCLHSYHCQRILLFFLLFYSNWKRPRGGSARASCYPHLPPTTISSSNGLYCRATTTIRPCRDTTASLGRVRCCRRRPIRPVPTTYTAGAAGLGISHWGRSVAAAAVTRATAPR